MKPRVGEVYEVPGGGSYRIVSIGPSPFTPGRYRRIGMRWLGPSDPLTPKSGTISYFDTKMMKRWGMKLKTQTRRSR